MANGFFLGGVAEGFNAQQKLGLQDRALRFQEQQLQDQQRQQLIAEAGKRISTTMDVIGKVIEGGKAGGINTDDISVYANAIASIESKGSGDYMAKGPVTKSGDRAYGRYQVMGNNIAPWTQEVLGKPMTVEEFIASPQAQDAVFQAKFGQFIQQSGGSAADAASIWFTGRPLAEGAEASDGNMTGSQYVERFLKNVAQTPQQKIMAAVDPLLSSVEGIASQIPGQDPGLYRKQVQALIEATPTESEKAIAAGQAAGTQKLAEAGTFMNAGISRIDSLISAGILTAERATAAEGGAGLPADKRIQYEGQMRDDFSALSKDFVAAKHGYERVRSAYDNPQTEAGISDIALVFGYMKTLDPNSTVREGEAASVREAQGVPSQVLNLYNRLVSGASLSQEARDGIVNLSEKFYAKWQKQHDTLVQRFTDIAKRSGLDPQNIVLDFGTVEPSADEVIKEGTIIENDSGTKMILRNGTWVPL